MSPHGPHQPEEGYDMLSFDGEAVHMHRVTEPGASLRACRSRRLEGQHCITPPPSPSTEMAQQLQLSSRGARTSG